MGRKGAVAMTNADQIGGVTKQRDLMQTGIIRNNARHGGRASLMLKSLLVSTSLASVMVVTPTIAQAPPTSTIAQAAPAGAIAQAAPAGAMTVEEVVVTATKVKTDLQKT